MGNARLQPENVEGGPLQVENIPNSLRNAP